MSHEAATLLASHNRAPITPAESDEHDYRRFADWADEFALDAGEVAAIVAADPSVRLDMPLTRDEMHDLVGLAARRPSGKEGGR